jgi:hypothetical protein
MNARVTDGRAVPVIVPSSRRHHGAGAEIDHTPDRISCLMRRAFTILIHEVCFLHEGQIAERGVAEEIFTSPRLPQTQRFLRRPRGQQVVSAQ